MTLLEQYFDCMQRADAVALADLFNDVGVLHDASWTKVGEDTLHLSGKMAIEMMFHFKFGFNGGPFKISGIRYMEENIAWYFIVYHGKAVPVVAYLSSVDRKGKIDRLNILPM
ncbi:MAG: hypothetical protein UDB11_11095 [Peptococcaceae bacterium]|nr:hypothetical protein [Peptococcaceae bacterium]